MKIIFVKIPLLLVLCISLLSFVNVNAQTKQIDSLRKVLAGMPADTNKAKTLRLLFIEVIDKQSADAAIPIAMQQLQLSQKIHYDRGIASAYKLLSVGYETLGNMDKSIAASLNSLPIYQKLHDNRGLAGAYSNIGLAYKGENQLAEALSYFKKSLDIYNSIHAKPDDIWRSTMNIGRTYEQQHNDSLALNSYLQSLRLCDKITANHNIYLSNSLLHIGEINYNRKQYSAAQNYVLQALKVVGPDPETLSFSEMYILLSKVYLAQHQPDKALSAAQKAHDIVNKLNFKSPLAESYFQLSKTYAALNNYGQAYRYQGLYLQLKDSLVNAEKIGKIAQLQYNYKLEKNEAVNRELLKNKKISTTLIRLQKTTIQRQYAMMALISVILLFSIILSVVYYRGLQQKRKDHQLLNLQQQEILEQNHEILAQNEEITNQREHLEQANKDKNKLFSIVSHDLRGPVLTLQDTLSLFNEKLLTYDDIRSASAELLTMVTNTSAMLDNVLYWAKNQMDGIRLNKQIFDIQRLIQTNLLNFQKQAYNKGITLINEQPDLPCSVYADPDTIDTVLRNLLSNAIKFCTTNDTVSVALKTDSSFLFVSVKDTGMGISAEVQQKLFNLSDFHTSYGTANEKGTGLGLNLCHDFITINGGTITVESAPGKGSIFTFTVPLAVTA